MNNLFAVWFGNQQVLQAGYRDSFSENPLVTQGAYGYDFAACQNLENYTVPLVTCQTFNRFT